ncbi:MAG TPA: hypothetical protein ENG26_03000, partial [Gammaproteobacteria bacterium]|nr:hypothetical protein [Gammaproteobacteria bacterium]
MMGSTWHRLKADRFGVTGLVIVACFAIVALSVWAGLLGQGWTEVSGERWESFSASHWFGTN